jgi:predicted phosphodiesterase
MRWLSPAFAFLVALGCTDCSRAPEPTGSATVEASQSIGEPMTPLPNAEGSFKFAVLGDFGTGQRGQYDLAAEMVKFHEKFKYQTVITVGDNLYGRQTANDFKNKFETPYKPLLDDGVKFYASLGNHDIREQPSYKLFNMEGKLFYTFKAPQQSVRFFLLDTNYLTPEQVKWIDDEMTGTGEDWKIAAFHHPLYSSARFHGSDLKLREKLEPLFIKHNVSVVLQGHDHNYERTNPQNGIIYFVAGSGGKLRKGDLDKSSTITAKGNDTTLAFMAVEIIADKMYFNTVSQDGQIIDSGIIECRKPLNKNTEKAAAPPPAKVQSTPRRP